MAIRYTFFKGKANNYSPFDIYLRLITWTNIISKETPAKTDTYCKEPVRENALSPICKYATES